MPLLLIADFFEGMDKLFFLLRLETAYYQGFTPSLIPIEVGVCTPPLQKEIFRSETKTAEKTIIYGHFRLKNILKFF